MLKTNIAFKSDEYFWNLPEWTYLVKQVSKVFRLTPIEVPNIDWIFKYVPLNLW